MSHHFGSTRKLGRSHNVAGFVAKLASEVRRFGHRDARPDGRLEVRVARCFADQFKSSNLRALAVRSIKLTADLPDERAFYYRLDTYRTLKLSGDQKCCRTDTALLYQSSHCRASESLHSERIDLLRIARAEKQQALGREIADVVEQHASVALAVYLAVLKQ